MPLPPDIRDFLEVIRYGRVDNSYKMVWGKAIIDLCVENPKRTDISLKEIAEKVFAYYWNLHIYFDPKGETLRQGSNSTKYPKILQIVLESIRQYKNSLGSNFNPQFYEQLASGVIFVDTQKIISILKENVSYRFLNLHKRVLNLYVFDKQYNKISFRQGVCQDIADHSDILKESINFRWTQILEDFNQTTPRIASKIRMHRDIKNRRKLLSPFAEWLLICNEECFCSQCGERILEDVHIDHMIPWSFLFHDDLWNLSFVHSECNLKKSNRPPSEKEINVLHTRNLELEKIITDKHPDKQGKIYKDLKFANRHELLRKMWMLYCNA